jgi:undecaprenyl-diphosphatase
VQYWRTFWAVGMGLLKLRPESLAFVRNILLGFLPSAVIGLAMKDYIDVLLGSPMVVGWALILAGLPFWRLSA